MDERKEQLRKLGFNIARIREKSGLSQSDLARMLGYTGHAYISRVESGAKAPSMKFVLSVAQILEVPPKEFFEDL